MTRPLSFSIVIPARNEASDIARTLDACLAIDYDKKEIIVVDDSTDNTPDIVLSYADRGVCLIHRDENRNGCCGARNTGMKAATGDIIVLLNADNIPNPSFLSQLARHYEDGADWVIVKPHVMNRDDVWGRYRYAQGQEKRAKMPSQVWSEGFSCRRSAAQEVGYIPGDFAVPFCRDYMLGRQLLDHGYNRHIDYTILAPHISPKTFSEFWNNRVWRGTFVPSHIYYFNRRSFKSVVVLQMLRAARIIARGFLIIPMIWRAARLARHVDNNQIPSFVAVRYIEDAATLVGYIKGLRRLAQTLRETG